MIKQWMSDLIRGRDREDSLFAYFYPGGYRPYLVGRMDTSIGLMLMLIAFVGYIRTLTPSVSPGDSGELITTLYQMGASHPPGYPFFGIFGKLFTFLPIGEIAYRVNIFTAFVSAGSIFFLYMILVKLLGLGEASSDTWLRVQLPAVGACMAFAFSANHWTQAVNGEVYALNTLLVSFLIYTMLLWHEEMLTFRMEKEVHLAPRTTLLLLFTMGLSLTNHQLPIWILVAWMCCVPMVYQMALDVPGRHWDKTLKSHMVPLILLGATLMISLALAWMSALEPSRIRVPGQLSANMIYPGHIPYLMTAIFAPVFFLMLYTAHRWLVPRVGVALQVGLWLVAIGLGVVLYRYIDYWAILLAGVHIWLLAWLAQAPQKHSWVDRIFAWWGVGMGLAIFAFSIYLYMYFRAKALSPLADPKPLSWGDTQRLDILFNHMLRKQYGGWGGSGLQDKFSQIIEIIRYHMNQFTITNVVLAGIGWFYMYQLERFWATFTGFAVVMFSTALLIFINFEVDVRTLGVQEVFFIQQFFMTTIWLAFCYRGIVDLLVPRVLGDEAFGKAP